MEAFYGLVFGVCAIMAAVLEWGNRSGADGKNSALPTDFVAFKNNYLLVYTLMMAGDWLQGPYVYALYQHYGFDRGDIGRLFIAGFGSSMVFGTIVGSLADQHGRKRAGLIYVASYTFGCFTKHFNNFYILCIGRIFCGVSTSLLFSAFESWLVAEHFKRGYNADWLGNTFSQAVFLGNGLIAICSGLLAHTAVETLQLGPVAPFDLAAVTLLVGGFIIWSTWSENYGDSSGKESFVESFTKASKVIRDDPKIALLGAMQSLFEGSMYTFVFLWTPALSPRGEHIPHGMIFACFMVSSMVGSALAGKLLSNNSKFKVEKYMQLVFTFSAACLFVPVLYHRMAPVDEQTVPEGTGITLEGKLQLVAFCAFEVMVGIFWPSMMTMRSAYVPEEMRATIINCFRIPLNLFVCLILYNVSSFPLAVMFGMCSVFLLVCLGCQRQFASIIHYEQAGTHFDEDDVEGTELLPSSAKARSVTSDDGAAAAVDAGMANKS